MILLSFQELMNKFMILLPDLFGYRCGIISPFSYIALGEAGNETCDQTAWPESGIVYHIIPYIRLTCESDRKIRTGNFRSSSDNSVADILLTVPRFQEQVEVWNTAVVLAVEITKHSCFIGDHQQRIILAQLYHKGFGRNIVHDDTDRSSIADIIRLHTELCYGSGVRLVLFLHCFDTGFQSLNVLLSLVHFLTVVFVVLALKAVERSFDEVHHGTFSFRRLCYDDRIQHRRFGMVCLARKPIQTGETVAHCWEHCCPCHSHIGGSRDRDRLHHITQNGR